MSSLQKSLRALLVILLLLAIWLTGLPVLLREMSFSGVNEVQPLEAGREFVGVTRIDTPGPYDCALVLQADTSLLAEIWDAIVNSSTRLGSLYSDYMLYKATCKVFPVSSPLEEIVGTTKQELEFYRRFSMLFSRVIVERYSRSTFNPGLYVVKITVDAPPAKLARLRVRARAELTSPPGVIRFPLNNLYYGADSFILVLSAFVIVVGAVLIGTVLVPFRRIALDLGNVVGARPEISPEELEPDACRARIGVKRMTWSGVALFLIVLAHRSLPHSYFHFALEINFVIAAIGLLIGYFEYRFSTAVNHLIERYRQLDALTRFLLISVAVVAGILCADAAAISVYNIVSPSLSTPSEPATNTAVPPPSRSSVQSTLQPAQAAAAATDVTPAETPAASGRQVFQPDWSDSPYHWKPRQSAPEPARFAATRIREGTGELLSALEWKQLRHRLAASGCESNDMLAYLRADRANALVVSNCYRQPIGDDTREELGWAHSEFPIVFLKTSEGLAEVNGLDAFGFMYESGSLVAVTDLDDDGDLELWLEGAICECDGEIDAEQHSETAGDKDNDSATFAHEVSGGGSACACDGFSVVELVGGEVESFQPDPLGLEGTASVDGGARAHDAPTVGGDTGALLRR